MATLNPEAALPRRPTVRNPLAPLATLTARRFQLSARTPRELLVPLLTPILFALVIAPALKQALHTGGLDYEAFVATGTIGLLVPLNTMFAGIGVIVDRESGAQRELLAAPIPRSLLVLGNLAVAFAITALQVGVLIAAAVARGISFDASGTGIAWFAAAAALFTIGMYGVAETLASRVPKTEEYVGARAGDRDRAVVLRRLALPDQRAARRPDVDREAPAPHPRARAHALRPAGRLRRACTTSGG